mmetsp:Transcript_2782/g.8442  ORF Transcript_2782/g.8442 Transcript_2782/m.8442 type:complete len:232 (+) Transcript_2782:3379-4074(+)
MRLDTTCSSAGYRADPPKFSRERGGKGEERRRIARAPGWSASKEVHGGHISGPNSIMQVRSITKFLFESQHFRVHADTDLPHLQVLLLIGAFAAGLVSGLGLCLSHHFHHSLVHLLNVIVYLVETEFVTFDVLLQVGLSLCVCLLLSRGLLFGLFACSLLLRLLHVLCRQLRIFCAGLFEVLLHYIIVHLEQVRHEPGHSIGILGAVENVEARGHKCGVVHDPDELLALVR